MSNLLAIGLLISVALVGATQAFAGQLTVHLGPPSIGNGGNNPLSIPPVNPLDYEVVYVTNNDWEWNIAIAPGLFAGLRSQNASGFYASFGGGLVIDYNGSGPGLYSAVGMDHGRGKTFRFNWEFKQALGVARGQVISPYALRLGTTIQL